VARIMKTAIPQQVKITKEAKGFMREYVSEFISFVTSEAVKVCQQEKRKALNGEDLLFAMDSLGFENYTEALRIYLQRYRDLSTARGSGGTQGASLTAPITSEPCRLDLKTWSPDPKPVGSTMDKGSAPLPMESSAISPRHQEGFQTGAQMATSGGEDGGNVVSTS
jgi:histone H3/H4